MSTQLPLVLAITTLAQGDGHMRSSTAAALVGAAVLSTLVYPILGLRMRGHAVAEEAAALSSPRGRLRAAGGTPWLARAAERQLRQRGAAVHRDRLAVDLRRLGAARNDTAAAISSGSTSRPAGAAASARARTSSGIASTCSVATRPGSTAFTVIPRRAFSARAATIPSCPAFEAA